MTEELPPHPNLRAWVMGTTHVDLPPAGLTTSTFQNNRFRNKFGMTIELVFNQYLIKIIYKPIISTSYQIK